jgi:hypothetical protein
MSTRFQLLDRDQDGGAVFDRILAPSTAPIAAASPTQTNPVSHAPIATAASYAVGAVVGGIIPAITWDVAHHQAPTNPTLWLAVAGGLLYSAPLVAAWFSRYVGRIKAWGFVAALETARSCSRT